jgi:mannose-6-phosphate isomerase-like protein (cupin superfamily)
LARSPRPTSTINSSRRQTTTYKADTSKGDLQQTGRRRRYRRLSSPRPSPDQVLAPHAPKGHAHRRGHRHAVQEEVYFLVSGRAQGKFDGEIVDIDP